MKNRRNYYRILHVQHDAPTEVIRSSYRTMMQRLKMHPDLGGDHEDAALVNEAYAVLTDPDARAEYDAGFPSKRGTAERKPETEKSQDNRTPEWNGSHCRFCGAKCKAAAHIMPDESCTSCGSALFPAERRELEPDSQRAIQRVAKRIPVLFWTSWPQASGFGGRSEDLSLGGMQLRTDEALAPGQIIRLTAGVIDALAVVVDRRILDDRAGYRWRVGLMFKTLRFHRSRGAFVSIDA